MAMKEYIHFKHVIVKISDMFRDINAFSLIQKALKLSSIVLTEKTILRGQYNKGIYGSDKSVLLLLLEDSVAEALAEKKEFMAGSETLKFEAMEGLPHLNCKCNYNTRTGNWDHL